MILQSGSVSLRPLQKSDAQAITSLANNEKIARNLRDGFPHPYTINDAEKFLEMVADQDPATIFAIEFKGRYVGNIGLTPETDVYRKSAEIGYFIGEPYWNKGIASAAVNLIVNYGFEKLDLVRIHTGVYEYNTTSQRVLEKCGFAKEGIFRKSIYKRGKILDEVRYAIINPAFD